MLAILGIGLFYAIKPRVGSVRPPAWPTAAHRDIYAIESALGAFKVDTGSYPTNVQVLFQQPINAENWHGPYLDKLPVDPWGNKYIYEYPGKHNANGYDLLSAGPDGKPGTGDDIGDWMN